MYSQFIFSALILALLSGCGAIEETEQGIEDVVDDNYNPNQNNTCYSNFENSAGCFGDDQYFGDNLVAEGYWSVYGKSNNNILYYDTYRYGYQFDNDGSVRARRLGQEYIYSSTSLWGVNKDGTKLTIEPDETFSNPKRITDTDCYEVTSSVSSQKLKICHENPIDTALQNGSGYYGGALKFGNYDYADSGSITVEGNWSIGGTVVTLKADGSTSLGGSWGLSRDGKLITVNAQTYLVYQYPGDDCITTFLMDGDNKTERVVLCKQ